jgi:hypothetical protein
MNPVRLACPYCLSPDKLGENVTGWMTCDHVELIDGRVRSRLQSSIVEDPERDSFWCSCDPYREIHANELVKLDRDGNPIIPNPDQSELSL